jgi:Mg-chelatase subunit ChlD
MNSILNYIEKFKKFSAKEASNSKRGVLADIIPVKGTPSRRKQALNSQTIDFESIVSVHLSSRFSKIKKSSEKQVIPLMVSYKSKEEDLKNNRFGLDLVIMIDVSSSMSGEKIQLVKQALLFIIDELQEKDRLSLIKFDNKSTILSNLSPMTSEFKNKLKIIVERDIQSCGGTNIMVAIEDGYKILLAREFVNDVTSMFILSDGEDTEDNTIMGFQKTMDLYDARMNYRSMDYKINSFGYGSGHDEKILGFISKYKDGNFYYIKDLKLVDECFIECLGYLMSIFNRKAEITIYMSNSAVFKKLHGNSWSTENSPFKSTLEIGSFAIGVQKNFMAEIEIPPLSSLKGTVKFAQAMLTFESLDRSHVISTEFSLTIVDDNDLGKFNSRVEKNIVRIQAAKTIQEAEKDFMKGKRVEARCKLRKFREDTIKNQYLPRLYANTINFIMEEDIYQNPKEFKQVEEMLSKQTFKPGVSCLGRMNNVQNQMIARKKY